MNTKKNLTLYKFEIYTNGGHFETMKELPNDEEAAWFAFYFADRMRMLPFTEKKPSVWIYALENKGKNRRLVNQYNYKFNDYEHR